MGGYIVDKLCDALDQRGFCLNDSKVLILGLTFKENCPDVRNSKVFDIYNLLEDRGVEVSVYDPLVFWPEVNEKFNLNYIEDLQIKSKYAAVILAVPHKEFLSLPEDRYRTLCLEDGVIFDIKSILSPDSSDLRL